LAAILRGTKEEQKWKRQHFSAFVSVMVNSRGNLHLTLELPPAILISGRHLGNKSMRIAALSVHRQQQQ
jgi:hypothetical protein